MATPANANIDRATTRADVSGGLEFDVGGAFADLAFIEGYGALSWIKTPSTPKEPGLSALNGVNELLSSAMLTHDALATLHHVHRATPAINKAIERKGARVGLITTEGVRDLLELQRSHQSARVEHQHLVEGKAHGDSRSIWQRGSSWN